MNIVNRSVEMKKPNTPMDSSENQPKYSRGNTDIFHEASTPVKTMIDERSSMATEIPSTPTE